MKKISIILFGLIALLTLNFSISGSRSTFSYSDSEEKDTLTILQPLNHYKTESQLLVSLLSRYHYKQVEIDDSLSEKIFNRYLKVLDNGKNYFLKSDIDKLISYKDKLDDNLLDGNLDFYFETFNLYRQRFNERLQFIDSLLNTEFDYSADENYQYNRDKASWAKDKSELDELWRKRLKNDALTYKLNGKDWEFIQKTLRKRYKNLANFINQYKPEDVFQFAMNSFTENIDPHTNYLSPVSSENFKIDMSLSLEGIGARLQTEDDYTKIVEIIPGGPAYKSGLLKADDKIIGVAQGNDGEFEDIIGWRITDAVKLIRGKAGTTVRLQIIKAGSDLNSKPIEITLVRDKIKLEDQAATGKVLEILNDDKPFRIGVIDIPKFYSDFEAQRNGDGDFRSTTRDVRKLIDSLSKENISGIIIDLREDGGGSLQEAIELTGLFIKDGPVVQVKNSDGKIDVAKDPDSQIVYDGPLAVLVNRFSASASEIFAGAIQDYQRGIIIGEQTFGKGTVQNLIDLNRVSSNKKNTLGQLKITIAKYYRVSGASTQNRGVIPDITFPSAIDPKDFGESAEPSALPYDEIKPASFNKFEDIKKFIPELLTKHQARISNDKDFEFLKEDIRIYQENKLKESISLNEDKRKIEKEDEEQRKSDRNAEIISNSDIELLDGEIPVTNNQKKDFILDETGKILSDLILLTSG
ncbi:MAG: carboxy terminal-processing peptidase [Ignavibacterium sp.]|jgi:carboxyl-terminal processing protease|nr:carboxy terminal-processing peptidase [Ignavibacterium sp.]MDX9712847.1 carboxy terminal-processing peptidase [Ignavibacteriaceae bacterium]MEB2353752.1 carboxy terminal-processing peptidase [Ignavibacteriales bacterium]